MKNIHIVIFLAVACLACDPYGNARYGMLTFSTDTLRFDTVFAEIGSVTGEFRVLNNTSDPLRLDQIYLGGGDDSPYRMNINGEPAVNSYEVVIPAHDSIFIFVDITVDPSGESLPVSVVDSVVFLSGEYISSVILEAWGQDIWLLKNETITGALWTKGKPYVIYGNIFVDTTAILSMEQGTRVLFHHNAEMNVAGTVIAYGTPDDPVLMASDRMASQYDDVPAQWKGITFYDCSSGNIFRSTVIRNAELAVNIAGSLTDMPDLYLEGCRIMHNSVGSVSSVHADILAVNTLFAHSGFNTLYLSGNGSCSFTHCTVANKWEYAYRSSPALYVAKADGVLPDVSIINSAITGSLDNEVYIDASPDELPGKVYVDSSLVTIDTLDCSWWNRRSFKGVLTGLNPKYIRESDYDFRPDTLSPLKDAAGNSEALLWPLDIRGRSRPEGLASDIGAYERYPGEKMTEEEEN